MAIQWRLKSLVAERGIYRARDLQKKIIQETGVTISLQNLCNLLKEKPKAVRLLTIEILCTALNCSMTDFCKIKAGKYDPQHIRKLSFQNTPHIMRGKSEFPDPKDYEK